RCALVQSEKGGWRLYVSYVDGADGRWRIDVIEANAPDAFDPATRTPVLTAGAIEAEGVKDPWVTCVNGMWTMIASFAPTPASVTESGSLHGTHDVYNTGLTRSLTGLATSSDGLAWQWEGAILEPRDGAWDAYAARINSAIRVDGAWVGYYDGSATAAENYEERCGAAISNDLRRWHRVSLDGPIMGSPSVGPGSVRYVEAIQSSGWIRYYYEYTRQDGAHELRTSLVRQPAETKEESARVGPEGDTPMST
ncbi:MAG: hypothetical protein KY456_14980, partial [Chloroflexi bacterium]|nr:hypothetical protein [Chloroflexota bacterium]